MGKPTMTIRSIFDSRFTRRALKAFGYLVALFLLAYLGTFVVYGINL